MHAAQKAQVAKTRVIRSACVDSGVMSGQNEFVANLSKRSACYEQRHHSQMQTDQLSDTGVPCEVISQATDKVHKSPSVAEQLFIEPIQAGVGHRQSADTVHPW